MTSDLSVSYSRIALFIDIENLIGAASTIGLPIDIAPVLDKLKEFGKVQVRRSFGDLDKCLRSVGKEREIYAVRDCCEIPLHERCVGGAEGGLGRGMARWGLIVRVFAQGYPCPGMAKRAGFCLGGGFGEVRGRQAACRSLRICSGRLASIHAHALALMASSASETRCSMAGRLLTRAHSRP